jgi:hypothetical protein
MFTQTQTEKRERERGRNGQISYTNGVSGGGEARAVSKAFVKHK